MSLLYSPLPKRTPFRPTHFHSTPSPPSSSSSSSHPTVTAADPTVTSAVTILKHHRSKSRWTHLLTLFPSFTPSQFTQITLHLRNHPHLALNFFHFTQHHHLCHHTPSSYSSIIHTLARNRQIPQTLSLIQSAIRHTQNPPLLLFQSLVRTYRMLNSAPFVFDLLVKACVRSNHLDEGLEITRMLRSKGVNPMIGTCNELISSVLKQRGSVAGYEVYNELFGDGSGNVRIVGGKNVVVPNVHTYCIVMVAFYRDGLVEEVERVWSDMVGNGCVPNEYGYSVLMAAYCDEGRMEDAVRVWEEMGESGVRRCVLAYNTMIGGFCGVGDVGKAEEFFREMGLSDEKGSCASCVTYEHLIKGYCKIGDVDLAMVLYKDMCREGFVAMGFTFDLLIKELCAKSKVSEAMIVSRFATKRNVVISGGSYEGLIKGLCSEGRMEEGMKLQAEMVGNGYEPNPEIYSAFISGYEKEGNVELAGKLRTELLGMR